MSESRRGDFYLLFLGLLLGFALSSFFSPKLIAWYSKPPFSVGVDCTPAVSWGMTQIVRWQLAGMFVGSMGLWAISALARKKRVKEE